MKWQPIETGPRDGEYVILCNKKGTWVGRYVERYVSGFSPVNPWVSMMLNHRHLEYGSSHVPTHWMPLPEPPNDKL